MDILWSIHSYDYSWYILLAGVVILGFHHLNNRPLQTPTPRRQHRPN